MIITTTQTIEGRPITEYLGIIPAVKNPTSALTIGNKALMRDWQETLDGINEIFKDRATQMGADAVVAVNYALFNGAFYATGTAVKLG